MNVRTTIFAFSVLFLIAISFQNCSAFRSNKSSADGFINGSSLNPSLSCKTSEIDHTTIRRLSNSEIANSLKDMLGISDVVIDNLPSDPTGAEGFTNNADVLKVSSDYLTRLLPVLETAVAKAVQIASPVFKCAGNKDTTCAQSLIQSFSRRAFRRMPSSLEMSGMVNLYNSEKAAGATFEEAVGAAYTRALLSPNFIFRTSIDGEVKSGGIVGMSQQEFVTKLSYFLWNSAPDQYLLDLADANGINSQEVLRNVIDRMLKDEKSKRFAELFIGQWLGIDRVLASGLVSREGLTDEMRKDMVMESKLFFSHVLRENKSIQDLMVGEYSFINERLANHYGMAGITGDNFRQVSLQGTGRKGLLTQSSFLTLQSSVNYTVPTSRGNKILSLVVCAPPPPFNLDETVTPLASNDPNLTIRQRMEIHRADPKCAGCHKDMDPIGLGLENFDHLGKLRTAYNNGLKIETDGNLRGVPFNDTNGLLSIIGEQNDYKRCISKNVMAYAIGRAITNNDQCVLQQIGIMAVQKDKTFTDLVMAIVMSDQFRFNNLNK